MYQTESVAPHAGAWIETYGFANYEPRADVAPHAGAWIETPDYREQIRKHWSHPMRVRGLKPKIRSTIV